MRFQPLNSGVDAGESSTISLALHWQATGERVLVIVDDRCGRAEARSQRVAITGTAAVLVQAKERNLIPACGPLLLALREQGHFLSDGVVAKARCFRTGMCPPLSRSGRRNTARAHRFPTPAAVCS